MKKFPLAALFLISTLAACGKSPQPPSQPPMPKTGATSSAPALALSAAMKTLNDAKQAGAAVEQGAQRTQQQIDQADQR